MVFLQALVAFFVNWLATRLREQDSVNVRRLLRIIRARVRVMFSPMGDGTLRYPVFSKDGTLTGFAPLAKPDANPPAFVVVDEAHHSLGPFQPALFAEEDRDAEAKLHAAEQTITHSLCASATHKTMLLSNFAQGTSTQAANTWAKGFTLVQLSEVVRNSKRIFDASLAFMRTDDATENQASITCSHEVAGPFLTPNLFECTEAEAPARYALEVVGTVRAMLVDYPGLPTHDQIAILVPNNTFCTELRPLLRAELAAQVPDLNFQVVSAVDAAKSQAFTVGAGSRHHANPFLILDTVAGFDGMERTCIICCGQCAPELAAAGLMGLGPCSPRTRGPSLPSRPPPALACLFHSFYC